VKRSSRKSKGADSDSAVRTVIVATKVLDALAEFRGPVRLVELARALKMTLPRVSRHVSTLRALGYIEKAEPLEAYRLGTKLFVMGQIALEQNTLVDVAPPHLSRLRDQIRRSVILSTYSGEGCVVLTCIPSNESPTIVVRPGTHLELPNSPSARILKAFSSDTREDGSPFHDAYPAERHRFIMAHYYDFEADTRGSGIGSIAAPVFDHNDQIVGAVAVVMPSTALADGPQPSIVKTLVACAAQISATMGSGAWSRKIGAGTATGPANIVRSRRKSRQAS